MRAKRNQYDDPSSKDEGGYPGFQPEQAKRAKAQNTLGEALSYQDRQTIGPLKDMIDFHKTPFVDGIVPVALGSYATAMRKARATALNVLSAI